MSTTMPIFFILLLLGYISRVLYVTIVMGFDGRHFFHSKRERPHAAGYCDTWKMCQIFRVKEQAHNWADRAHSDRPCRSLPTLCLRLHKTSPSQKTQDTLLRRQNSLQVQGLLFFLAYDLHFISDFL